jgi:hypothetical protein
VNHSTCLCQVNYVSDTRLTYYDKVTSGMLMTDGRNPIGMLAPFYGGFMWNRPIYERPKYH